MDTNAIDAMATKAQRAKLITRTTAQSVLIVVSVSTNIKGIFMLLACGICGGIIEPVALVAALSAGMILTDLRNRIAAKRNRQAQRLTRITSIKQYRATR